MGSSDSDLVPEGTPRRPSPESSQAGRRQSGEATTLPSSYEVDGDGVAFGAAEGPSAERPEGGATDDRWLIHFHTAADRQEWENRVAAATAEEAGL